MIQFENKLSIGTVISIGVYAITIIGGGAWMMFQIEAVGKSNDALKIVIERLNGENATLSTKLAVLESQNSTFQQVRDSARELDVRVRAVEKKSDEISAIALEMREIKGELKGIAEAMRRVDRAISRTRPIAPGED